MTTVDFEPLAVAVPLREEPPGVFRVGRSRVLLELVIRAFQKGQAIAELFLAVQCLSPEECRNQVTYFPL
jgi:hypothetical protein